MIFEVPNAVCALCEEHIEISCHMKGVFLLLYIIWYFYLSLAMTCVTDTPNLPSILYDLCL